MEAIEAKLSTKRRLACSTLEMPMKAAVYTRYGSPEVVSLREVPRPSLPPDGVVVRVRATTVSSGDARLRSANVPPGFGILLRLGFGVFGPRKHVLGTEIAG